jgi:hypothetical protein
MNTWIIRNRWDGRYFWQFCYNRMRINSSLAAAINPISFEVRCCHVILLPHSGSSEYDMWHTGEKTKTCINGHQQNKEQITRGFAK